LKVADERSAILRWAVGYAWHILRFHDVRLPIYQLRFTLWAPRGLVRTVRAIVDGLLDSEARPLRRSAVVRDDVREWMALAKERNARVRHRSVALVLSIPVLAWVAAMVLIIDGLLWWACTEALILLFGAVGRPQGARLVSRATVPLHLAPVLRADVVEVALRAVPGLMRKDVRIEFPDPIVKDGPGWFGADQPAARGDAGRRGVAGGLTPLPEGLRVDRRGSTRRPRTFEGAESHAVVAHPRRGPSPGRLARRLRGALRLGPVHHPVGTPSCALLVARLVAWRPSPEPRRLRSEPSREGWPPPTTAVPTCVTAPDPCASPFLWSGIVAPANV
jgi:hypothetical protein